MRFLSAVLLLCLGAVSALPPFTRVAAPEGWTLGERAHQNQKVQITLGLVQRNLDVLNAQFEAVSTPGSPAYRQFLSAAEVSALTAPSFADKKRVLDWLNKYGVSDADTGIIRDTGDAVHVELTVAQAESMFHTKMHSFHSSKKFNDAIKKRTVIRSFGSYHVDASISPLIELVDGLSSFPVEHYAVHSSSAHKKHAHGSKHFKQIVNAPLADKSGIIAQSINALYNVPVNVGLSTNTSQGVIEFEGQYFSSADLTKYGTQVGLKLKAVTAAHTVGTNNQNSPQTESTLDIDMVASVNTEADNWFWIEPGQGWMYTWSNHFATTADIPQVVSISYGLGEATQCSADVLTCLILGIDSTAYVQRVNAEFQKIGLRGTSILVSSGDSGAHGREDPYCTAKTLGPDYPGVSPYVTSIGATQIVNAVYGLENPPPICSTSGYQCVSGGLEQAVSYAFSGFTSGGGFSNVAARPSYQSAAVSAYLSSGVALPPASYFNSTGRGHPDVSAVGHNNLILQSGSVLAVGGTSASAPIWAGVVALLNQIAVSKDGKPLGFLNPLLYAAPKNAFQDITVGDNKCTEQGCAASCTGYVAAVGWDPVTGLGSPNYPNLAAYVESQL